ncbi:hypothetical protein [Candidatus Hakubella thermalkaliphila]|nr:hypothetical protein [Candidatus Hakubella thermalkaliphila]
MSDIIISSHNSSKNSLVFSLISSEPSIPDINAIPSAPASITSLILSFFIPPIAKTGIEISSFAFLIISTQRGCPYLSFDGVL